jgi:E3 ubiquitin-protein ligase RNF14
MSLVLSIAPKLTCLQSIYPDQITRHSGEEGQTIFIRIDITLSTPTKVVCRQEANTSSSSVQPLIVEAAGADLPSIGIVTPVLPPILVNLHLPQTYPQSTAPTIKTLTNADASETWLPSRTEQRVKNELEKLWAAAEGEGVLWSWVDWLASGAFLDGGEAEEDMTKEGEAYM